MQQGVKLLVGLLITVAIAIAGYYLGRNSVVCEEKERVVVIREVHNPVSDTSMVKMEEMHEIVSHADSIVSIVATDSTINEALEWIKNR